ncbi:MAG: protein translocase subunit SecF [bacterium]
MDEKIIKYNLIGSRNLWFIISVATALIGIGALFALGLNLGVDFTGGRIIFYKADWKVRTSEVDRVVRRFDIKHNPIQILEGGREFVLRTVDYSDKKRAAELNQKIQAMRVAFAVEFTKLNPDKFILRQLESRLTQERLENVLEKKKISPDLVELVSSKEVKVGEGDERQIFYDAVLRFKGELRQEKGLKKAAEVIFTEFGGHPHFQKEDKVDPLFGAELMRRAGITLLLATALILIYVTVRFEFWFAVAAIIALVHDCFITIGFYAILQLEVNVATVAVILTVFGYSINDTIIIFDRIRENRKKYKREPLLRTMNYSLWETMPRSVNTVTTTLMPITAIILFGGVSLGDFAKGLFVGIMSGCYSSIFVAAPLAFVFKKGAQEERRTLADVRVAAEAQPREIAKAQPAVRKVSAPKPEKRPAVEAAADVVSEGAEAKKGAKSGKKKHKRSRRR